jgi:hypothetical protein
MILKGESIMNVAQRILDGDPLDEKEALALYLDESVDTLSLVH